MIINLVQLFLCGTLIFYRTHLGSMNSSVFSTFKFYLLLVSPFHRNDCFGAKFITVKDGHRFSLVLSIIIKYVSIRLCKAISAIAPTCAILVRD